MQNEPVDVLIIGAGASGAAIAWSLLETRMRILCLEQGPRFNEEDFPSRDGDYELARYGKFSCDPNVRGLKQDYPINAEDSCITPVNFNAVGVLMVVIGATLTSLLATIYPAWRAGQILPAEALRYDQ